MIVSAGVDWTTVLASLIAALPAIIAAVFASRIHNAVRTPSGKSIGKQVEDALHTVRSNYYTLDTIGTAVSAAADPDADAEARLSSDPPKRDIDSDPVPPEAPEVV